jgi:2-polyprenyl-3-methyl-5-hydroxy-6-metoxy-1,4-benzoquinol methylase
MNGYRCPSECADMITMGEQAGYSRYRCPVCEFEHFFDEHGVAAASLYEFDSDYNDDLIVVESIHSLMQWNHRKALSFIEELNVPPGAQTLDVGCFNGFFVAQLLRRGFDAAGIDFNTKALAHGREKFGLEGKICDTSLEELLGKNCHFDVVTLFEVLEHLPAPAEFLDSLSSLLSPGGLLIISTPNSRMSWRPKLDSPPHHLSRFTPAALQTLAESQGLVVLAKAEQASLFNMLRHMAGSLFRSDTDESLRGGEFRAKRLVHALRRIANRVSRAVEIIFWPVDRFLYFFGFRYIGQLIVLQKPN